MRALLGSNLVKELLLREFEQRIAVDLVLLERDDIVRQLQRRQEVADVRHARLLRADVHAAR